METNSVSETDSLDTNTRIGTKSSNEDWSNDTASTTIPTLAESGTTHHGQPCFFDGGSDEDGDALDGFVADITTIAQSWCERATDYAKIETLVCCLPIDHLRFTAHDSSAPYSGPYPMALLVRAFLIEEINGWDETVLHDYLRAHPSRRQDLGFETLPNQSTFWRAWNERFSEALRDAIHDCADKIVRVARACEVSLPERVETAEADESEADDRPEH